MKGSQATSEGCGRTSPSAILDRIGDAKQGALVLLEADGIQHARAALGPGQADALSHELYRRLTGAIRAGDRVFALGQGRFGVVAPGLTKARAARGLCERLLATVDVLEWKGRPVQIALVAGVCFYPGDAEGPEEVCRRAEAALACVRGTWRRVAFYERGLEAAQSDALLLGGELKRALRIGELRLVYQPKYEAATRRLVGAEALMRWSSATLGIISPGRFIPVAESTGLITALTDFAVQEAAKQAQRWAPLLPEDFRISVNLSGGELNARRLSRLLTKLAQSHAPTNHLQFEITESVLMDPQRKVEEALELVREAGIELAIDDFGTGYSSLAYLTRINANDLKIDRAFVRDLQEPGVKTLLRSVVELGHALDMRIVVEGVEQDEQLATVTELGADVVQGYLTGRPQSAASIEAQLRRAPKAAPGRAAVPRKRAKAGSQKQGLRRERLPVLPAVYVALERLRRAGDSLDHEALRDLVASDPVLTMRALSFGGQSSFGGKRVLSVRAALRHVGPSDVICHAKGEAVAQVFALSEVASSIWSHSIQAAEWAVALADIALPAGMRVSPGAAHAAGLLHDLGRIAMLAERPSDVEDVDGYGWSTPAELVEVERRLLNADHATIGGIMARAHSLPEELTAVIEHHHRASIRHIAPRARALVHIVRAADVLALELTRQPELGRASLGARVARLEALISDLCLPFPMPVVSLAERWGKVERRSQRRLSLVGF